MVNVFTSSSVWLALVLAIAVALCWRQYSALTSDAPLSTEQDMRRASYFSEDYSQARRRFLAAAAALNGSWGGDVWLSSHPVDAQLGLFIDVVAIPAVGTVTAEGDSDSRVLLHISGTHGVEGYAGSAIQTAFLEELLELMQSRDQSAAPPRPRPAVVLVHALNPFGFAANRRANEDNVDLNRNFLRPEEFAALRARDPNFAGYADLAFLLDAPRAFLGPSLWRNQLHGMFLLLYSVLAVGVGRVKTALLSGNYAFPWGVGYGGTALTRSALVLTRLLEGDELGLPSARHLLLVDVHTGLGPRAVDSLSVARPALLSAASPSLAVEDEGEIFATERDGGRVTGGLLASLRGADDPASTFYGYALTRGTVTEDLCAGWLARLPGLRSLACVLQEFGTLPSVLVGKALFDENNAHRFGSPALRHHYTTQLKKAFCPDSGRWRAAVVRRGLAVIEEATTYLISRPPTTP